MCSSWWICAFDQLRSRKSLVSSSSHAPISSGCSRLATWFCSWFTLSECSILSVRRPEQSVDIDDNDRHFASFSNCSPQFVLVIEQSSSLIEKTIFFFGMCASSNQIFFLLLSSLGVCASWCHCLVHFHFSTAHSIHCYFSLPKTFSNTIFLLYHRADVHLDFASLQASHDGRRERIYSLTIDIRYHRSIDRFFYPGHERSAWK